MKHYLISLATELSDVTGTSSQSTANHDVRDRIGDRRFLQINHTVCLVGSFSFSDKLLLYIIIVDWSLQLFAVALS